MSKFFRLFFLVATLAILYLSADIVAKYMQDVVNSESFNKYTEDLKKFKSDAFEYKDDEELVKGLSGNNVYVEEDYYIYYTYLNDNEKIMYKQVFANASNANATFTSDADISPESLEKVVKFVYYDHPELFWLDNSFTYKYDTNNVVREVTLSFNETINYLDEAKIAFNNKVDEIVNEAAAYQDILDKERFVHDKLLTMVEYDTNAKLDQTAYSAIVLGKSVCAGYSKAFQYIMTKLGIPTYYVIGFSETDHAWNIVKLGNTYLNVDVTWDDQARYKYTFYNKKDSDFGDKHIRKDESLLLPSCS